MAIWNPSRYTLYQMFAFKCAAHFAPRTYLLVWFWFGNVRLLIMIFFNCTVFSWGMWKLCSHNSVANSDGVERLLWDFQMNITGKVSYKKKT